MEPNVKTPSGDTNLFPPMCVYTRVACESSAKICKTARAPSHIIKRASATHAHVAHKELKADSEQEGGGHEHAQYPGVRVHLQSRALGWPWFLN